MKIFSNFDSGSIHVVSADNKDDIQLKIPNDNMSEFYQWFHFRLETQAEASHTIKLLGWPNRRIRKAGRATMWWRLTIVKSGSAFRLNLMATP